MLIGREAPSSPASVSCSSFSFFLKKSSASTRIYQTIHPSVAQQVCDRKCACDVSLKSKKNLCAKSKQKTGGINLCLSAVVVMVMEVTLNFGSQGERRLTVQCQCHQDVGPPPGPSPSREEEGHQDDHQEDEQSPLIIITTIINKKDHPRNKDKDPHQR